jgi:aspartate kinase
MLIVQKYGGTSVGSIERILAVAKRVIQTKQQGHEVVVVVSAMGKTTDGLVKLANEISNNPQRREMDMLLSTGEQVTIALLSMALESLGQPSISLTGGQAGILTEAEHSRARILEIDTQRLRKHLDENRVVVVAGFQGISNQSEITTLGRGGSDTSAVALAAALNAHLCEIYTDVEGILTTDPRLVPQAQLLTDITSDEMLELASLGAKVLHPRAVEIARNYGIPLVVRSSWTDHPGTKVISGPASARSLIGLEITRAVDAVELDTDQSKVALLHVPDRPGVAAKLFKSIAKEQINVDLIIQSIHEGNSNDIAFTVTQNSLELARTISLDIDPTLRNEHNTSEVIVDREVAKISITGAGMIGRPGIAAKMFQTLADVGINIEMISTSEIKVSCVIAAKDAQLALKSLMAAFEIEQADDQNLATTINSKELSPVRGVALDRNQAKIAVRNVPDKPGMSAKIFATLAQENISVDMIIQSQRSRIINEQSTRDIAFTISEIDAPLASSCLEKAGFKDVILDYDIVKVSIVGFAMINQPGVAANFFSALAQENINIQMIATSEIKVSCVVNKSDGERALAVVHEIFNLANIFT